MDAFFRVSKILKTRGIDLRLYEVKFRKNYQSYCYGICAIDRKLAMVNHYHRETVSSFV